MLRRNKLKGGCAIACAMATRANAFPALAGPTNGSPGPAQRVSMKFAGALRAIGGDACIAAAQRLEVGEGGNGDISLHLRRANLNTADAIVFARAMSGLTDGEGLTLGSLSLSYNPGIGDAAASGAARHAYRAWSCRVRDRRSGRRGIAALGRKCGQASYDLRGRQPIPR